MLFGIGGLQLNNHRSKSQALLPDVLNQRSLSPFGEEVECSTVNSAVVINAWETRKPDGLLRTAGTAATISAVFRQITKVVS
jgi:hypothetical protein